EAFEKQVAADMKTQQEWTQAIKPRAALLKYRPPYGKGTFKYLDGQVMLQAWATQRSTEARLVVDRDGGFKQKSHDHGAYEDAMYYLNVILREWAFYPHTVKAKGIDHCYDCKHEILAWEAYLKKAGRDATPKEIGKMFDTLTERTLNKLEGPRLAHGVDPAQHMYCKRHALYEARPKPYAPGKEKPTEGGEDEY
ncbi:MAG: hypothetical protein KGL39_26600, partial [Patescibacteria group bacterium]|nr:hypothetical protein [Patescibacteria group bacterium]